MLASCRSQMPVLLACAVPSSVLPKYTSTNAPDSAPVPLMLGMTETVVGEVSTKVVLGAALSCLRL